MCWCRGVRVTLAEVLVDGYDEAVYYVDGGGDSVLRREGGKSQRRLQRLERPGLCDS
jgi:hypothetical protein